MPRFFIDKIQVSGNSAIITGDDAHHISRSLRMRVGEQLTLCDGEGTDHHCEIVSITDKAVECAVLSSEQNTSEPPYRATVYQALAKGDRFDTVIQKSVECGAIRIVPLMTKRCTVKLEKSDFAKKCARWNKIAEEAAKQCGRGLIPKVDEPITFAEMLSQIQECDLPLFCYEKGTFPIKKAVSGVDTGNCSASVIIGPEGGFADEEAYAAEEAGVLGVTLGRRILRTESAAPFVLACLSFAFEQSDK